jgi:hypothetical protein
LRFFQKLGFLKKKISQMCFFSSIEVKEMLSKKIEKKNLQNLANLKKIAYFENSLKMAIWQ